VSQIVARAELPQNGRDLLLKGIAWVVGRAGGRGTGWVHDKDAMRFQNQNPPQR
jgi:hypothetical protein